jgi:iron(III) transport system substrate-binding protein
MNRRAFLGLAAAALLAVGGAACGDADEEPEATSGATQAPSGTITLYSGRSESLVGPLIEQFEKDTGINVQVRYGGSAEMAATISEEGSATPADVFWSQDPGPLGALSDRFATLPSEYTSTVDAGFRSPEGKWVGVSGRARVIVYNPQRVQPADLPKSILDFTDPEWKGRIGWAPTNASLQVMVTALRTMEGEDVARQWLEGIKANGAKTYGNNGAVLQAVAAGEVDVGFVNHYYLHAARRTTPNINAENHYLNNSEDAGALIMVSGVGVLSTSDNKPAAQRFVEYLLSATAQQYFVDETSEYPVIAGINTPPTLTPLAQLKGPKVDLADLADLQGTLALLRQTGVVP